MLRRIVCAVFAATVIGIVGMFIYRPPMLVLSPSMSPNLNPGNIALVRPLWPWETLPERGRIIAIRMPQGRIILKRVIALPGEVMQTREDILHINDTPVVLTEASCLRPSSFLFGIFEERLSDTKHYFIFQPKIRGPFSDSARLVAPRDHVLVLGDHRGHSTDSRSPDGPGAVSRQMIYGVVWGIIGASNTTCFARFFRWA